MSTLVVVERPVDPPVQVADIAAMESATAWCMEQHRVDHLTSLVALDGRELVCLFAAPDAEAVRTVLHQLGEQPTRVWAATPHASPALPVSAPLGARNGDPIVAVTRCFDAPVDLAALQASEDAHAWCLEQNRVRFLRSYVARDGRRMLCLYAAPDAEAVRRTQQQAGLPVERIWPTRLFESALPAAG